jgi:hypothetical protein
MQLEQKNSIRVLYGKKREYESLLGRTERGKPKVYLQVMASQPEGSLMLCPISPNDYELMRKRMKKLGPVSGDDFNNMVIQYASNIHAKPFSVDKLTIDEKKVS